MAKKKQPPEVDRTELSIVMGRWVRQTRGVLTQPQFAARVKLPQSTVSGLENGGRELVYDHLEKIVVGMGIDLVTVFRGMKNVALQRQEELSTGVFSRKDATLGGSFDPMAKKQKHVKIEKLTSSATDVSGASPGRTPRTRK